MAHLDNGLGARVSAARGYAKLTRSQLGDALGIDRRVVAAIEDDDDRHPLTVKEMQRIAQICDVPASFLVSGWTAPRQLREHVAALEAEVRKSAADRDLLAAQIEALDARLEKRFAELSNQGLAPSSPPAHGADRRRRGGPPTR